MRAGYQRETAGAERISGVQVLLEDQHSDLGVKKVICVLQSACRWKVWKQQASGNSTQLCDANRPQVGEYPSKQRALQWRGIRQTRRKLCIAWADCRMMQMRQVQNESRCRSTASVDRSDQLVLSACRPHACRDAVIRSGLPFRAEAPLWQCCRTADRMLP